MKCEVERNTEGILKSASTRKSDQILREQNGNNMSNLSTKKLLSFGYTLIKKYTKDNKYFTFGRRKCGINMSNLSTKNDSRLDIYS